MYKIINIERLYVPAVLQLANQIHGDNYLDASSLYQLCELGVKSGLNASFVAINDQNAVIGYRLSLAAGQWPIDHWCSISQWPFAPADMAYFKSVGVLAEYQGQGIAQALLQASIEVLQAQGAKAGLAHIWRESPGNAAERYFTKAGASLIKVHADRWLALSEQAGYACPICGNRCHCSAAEMLLPFTMAGSNQ
jgi:GNAT superfamily N-acetyltransferase